MQTSAESATVVAAAQQELVRLGMRLIFTKAKVDSITSERINAQIEAITARAVESQIDWLAEFAADYYPTDTCFAPYFGSDFGFLCAYTREAAKIIVEHIVADKYDGRGMTSSPEFPSYEVALEVFRCLADPPAPLISYPQSASSEEQQAEVEAILRSIHHIQ